MEAGLHCRFRAYDWPHLILANNSCPQGHRRSRWHLLRFTLIFAASAALLPLPSPCLFLFSTSTSTELQLLLAQAKSNSTHCFHCTTSNDQLDILIAKRTTPPSPFSTQHTSLLDQDGEVLEEPERPFAVDSVAVDDRFLHLRHSVGANALYGHDPIRTRSRCREG